MSTTLDPQLPFIQVHRSVGAKAAQLASALGVTYQHARGSLDVFWESLADRRLWSGQTELVLAAAELTMRLRMAFGVDVDLDLMRAVGFLEAREGGRFRVRGMSTYLNAELGRLAKKHPGLTRPPPGSDPGATPVGPRSDPGSDPGATPVAPGSQPTEVRGERREVRVEKATAAEAPVAEHPFIVEPPDTPMAVWTGHDFWRWAQHKRQQAGFAPERALVPAKLGGWWHQVRMVLQDVEALREAYYRYGEDSYWQKQNLPFRAFMAKWESYVPRGGVRVPA